jgi:hypothetical protein
VPGSLEAAEGARQGDEAVLTEFDAAGNDALDMSFGNGVKSYRT